MRLSPREAATLVAALHYWRREGLVNANAERDIATAAGCFPALSASEVARLAGTIAILGEVKGRSLAAQPPRADRAAQRERGAGVTDPVTSPFFGAGVTPRRDDLALLRELGLKPWKILTATRCTSGPSSRLAMTTNTPERLTSISTSRACPRSSSDSKSPDCRKTRALSRGSNSRPAVPR